MLYGKFEIEQQKPFHPLRMCVSAALVHYVTDLLTTENGNQLIDYKIKGKEERFGYLSLSELNKIILASMTHN